MANPTWDNLIDPHHTARGAAKNTFTTFADFSPTPIPQVGSYELKLGTKIVVEAIGEFKTTGTPTLAIGCWYGAAASNWQTTAITTGSGAASWPWHFRWNGIVTAVGSTSTSLTIYGHGILDLGTSLTAFTGSAAPATAAARSVASLDNTVAKQIGIGAAFGTSSASNEVTCDVLNVQILNQGKT